MLFSFAEYGSCILSITVYQILNELYNNL